MNSKLFLLLLTLFFFASCNEETEIIDIDYGYNFYPLQVGKYVIYDVDSIVYDFAGTATIVDTTTYQAKEEIIDTTTDNEGRTVFVVHYSQRVNPSFDWEIKDVYTVVKTQNWVEKTEGGFRFTKFIFPPKVEAEWDGNRYFSDENITLEVRGETLDFFKNWSSKIVGETANETIGTETFGRVLTVQHADNENLLEKRYFIEKYAEGVGLVSKTMMILDTQCGGDLANCIGKTWAEKAEKGFMLNMTLNTHN
jgi:hypothetical protein